jgi:hypothetical protein
LYNGEQGEFFILSKCYYGYQINKDEMEVAYVEKWRICMLCVISLKVAGLIPEGVTGILHLLNPSGCTTAQGSVQPVTDMSTRNISWV